MAVEFTTPEEYTMLHAERVPIRLGHQVFLTGRLAPETMDATVEAFQRFRKYLQQFDIEHYRAVATSAVREARNGPLLVERIERETGIRLKAITGSEEARLVHLAVGARIDLEGGRWLLVDLGGGSVELSLVDDSECVERDPIPSVVPSCWNGWPNPEGNPGRFSDCSRSMWR